MEYNGFKIGDLDSLENKIFSTQKTVYDAPERAVEMLTIPGRNGAIALDQGRWENQPVTYRCGCYAESDEKFAERIAAFRSKLLLKTSYEILTDSYNPDEFRLGLYKNGLEADTVSRNHAGEFDVEFDCKPQRFLVSGNDPKTVGEWGETTKLSGDIVTFESGETDAFKSLSVEMEPVQDLNGYDHPWVGGAGKNKFDVDAWIALGRNSDYYSVLGSAVSVIANDNGGISNRTIQLKPSTQYVISFANASSCRVFDDTGNTLAQTSNDRTSVTFITTDSGKIAVKFYGSTYPTVIGKVQIEEGSTATSWTPYSNICPISGHTEVVTQRTGVNLWDEEWEVGGIHTDGSLATNSYRLRSKNYISIIPNTAYYFASDVSLGYSSWLIMCFYDGDKNFVSFFTSVVNRTFNTPSNARFMKFCTSDAWNGRTYEGGFSINYPSTDTEYHAYQGTTYTTSLGQTVYGGTLDLVSGVLTVDRKMVVWNGSEPWYTETIASVGARSFYKGRQSDAQAFSDIHSGDIILNLCPVASSWREGTMRPTSGYYNFLLGNTLEISTVAEWQSYLASNPIQLCYKLATPQTYQLDPQTINTLVGVNNVWANAGAVTVEYGASPYIFYNDTGYPAKPLIVITGNGTVGVGKHLITVEGATSPVYIDCESMEIYTESGGIISGASSLVSFNTNEFPTLEAGANGVSVGSGISSVVITPRWWRL